MSMHQEQAKCVPATGSNDHRQWMQKIRQECLLLLAEQSGKYNVKEIPVSWAEEPDTKVKIFKTVYSYIKNLIKLKIRLL